MLILIGGRAFTRIPQCSKLPILSIFKIKLVLEYRITGAYCHNIPVNSYETSGDRLLRVSLAMFNPER